MVVPPSVRDLGLNPAGLCVGLGVQLTLTTTYSHPDQLGQMALVL